MNKVSPPQCLSTDVLPVGQPLDSDLIARVTRAVRSADLDHEHGGGSSRHYARDYLLPALAVEGLIVLLASKVTVQP